MTEVVGFFAALVQIAAHIFVLSVLLFASSLLVGAVACRWCCWINSRRLRVDCSTHESRGWKQ